MSSYHTENANSLNPLFPLPTSLSSYVPASLLVPDESLGFSLLRAWAPPLSLFPIKSVPRHCGLNLPLLLGHRRDRFIMLNWKLLGILVLCLLAGGEQRKQGRDSGMEVQEQLGDLRGGGRKVIKVGGDIQVQVGKVFEGDVQGLYRSKK